MLWSLSWCRSFGPRCSGCSTDERGKLRTHSRPVIATDQAGGGRPPDTDRVVGSEFGTVALKVSQARRQGGRRRRDGFRVRSPAPGTAGRRLRRVSRQAAARGPSVRMPGHAARRLWPTAWASCRASSICAVCGMYSSKCPWLVTDRVRPMTVAFGSPDMSTLYVSSGAQVSGLTTHVGG